MIFRAATRAVISFFKLWPLLGLMLSLVCPNLALATVTGAVEESETHVFQLGNSPGPKQIEISPNANFLKKDTVTRTTSGQVLRTALVPGRYFYRFRSSSEGDLDQVRSGLFKALESPDFVGPNIYTIVWEPPVANVTYHLSMVDSAGKVVIADKEVRQANPELTLPGTGTYFWTISPTAGNFWSAPKPFVVPPGPPAGLRSAFFRNGQLTLKWDRPNNAEIFSVRISDEDGFEVLNQLTRTNELDVPALKSGSYKVEVASGVAAATGGSPPEDATWAFSEHPSVLKFVAPTLERDEELRDKVHLLSPLGRYLSEGRKLIFSWSAPEKFQKFRLQIARDRLSGKGGQLKEYVVTGRAFDDSLFQQLPLGVYKARVVAVGPAGDFLLTADTQVFTKESAAEGAPSQGSMSFGGQTSLNAYSFSEDGRASSFDAQNMGFFASAEEVRGKRYRAAGIRNDILLFKASTLYFTDISYGQGIVRTTPQLWTQKFGLHAALMRSPEVLAQLDGSFTKSQMNFFVLRPRAEFGKNMKFYSYQFAIDTTFSALQFSDSLKPSFAPFWQPGFNYHLTADAQAHLSWPWSVGAELGFESIELHYRSTEGAVVSSQTSILTLRGYLTYTY